MSWSRKLAFEISGILSYVSSRPMSINVSTFGILESLLIVNLSWISPNSRLKINNMKSSEMVNSQSIAFHCYVQFIERNWYYQNMKWSKERLYHPSEEKKISEEYGAYVIIFFVVFSMILILLYIFIICYGFYKSLNEASRKVSRYEENQRKLYRSQSCPMDEV